LEYNETVHQLFVDFKKSYDSLRRELLCNILVEFWVCMKVVRLNKMYLNETYSKVCIGKYLSEDFLIQNGLKQGDALSPLSTLLWNMPLGEGPGKPGELKLNGTHQLLVYADDVNLLVDIETIKKNTQTWTLVRRIV
jgi:hypothetical protein